MKFGTQKEINENLDKIFGYAEKAFEHVAELFNTVSKEMEQPKKEEKKGCGFECKPEEAKKEYTTSFDMKADENYHSRYDANSVIFSFVTPGAKKEQMDIKHNANRVEINIPYIKGIYVWRRNFKDKIESIKPDYIDGILYLKVTFTPDEAEKFKKVTF